MFSVLRLNNKPFPPFQSPKMDIFAYYKWSVQTTIIYNTIHNQTYLPYFRKSWGQHVKVFPISVVSAVKSIFSHDLVSDIDLRREHTTEQWLFQSSVFNLLVVLRNDFGTSLVVLLECSDGSYNLVIMCHYFHKPIDLIV